MLQKYKNAVDQYNPVDCRILSAVNSINRLGSNIDPIKYYGLSKGLSFYLLESEKNNIITFPYARSKGSEISFIKEIGFNLKIINPQSISEIDKYLDEGFSVIIDVDRYYLPPFTEKFGASHFGYHSTNIVGYDFFDEEKVYYGLEFLRPEPYIYKVSQIEKARLSKCDFIQPNGQIYIISGKQKIKFDSNFYVNQVYDCACDNINSQNTGISALKKFLRSLIKISVNPFDSKNKQFANQIRLLKNAVRIAETTASSYREFYSLFLAEAYKITGILEFMKLSNLWKEIARLWNQIIGESWSEYETKLWITHISTIIDKESFVFEHTLKVLQ